MNFKTILPQVYCLFDNISQNNYFDLLHSGDCPFQCQICQSKFKINSDLKRHMRLHTGEKPFNCQLCDYKCAIKGNIVEGERMVCSVNRGLFS